MNPPPEKTLGDKQSEIVRAWLKPFADGLSGKARVTPDDQLHFQRCISTDERGVDAIDRDLDDDLVVPWADINPPARRKDSEVSKLLDLLDNLPTGKETE